MSNDIHTASALIEAESREDILAAPTPKEKVLVVFRKAQNHWMYTDEDVQMTAALNAAMHHMDEEEKESLVLEAKVLQAISAGIDGLPIDFSQVKLPEKTIGIMALWEQVKEEKK